MLFNSWQFAFFFPVVALLVLFGPPRSKLLVLFFASCIFYMAFAPAYIVLVFITIGVDYYAALGIERSTGRARKGFLALGVIVPLLSLGFFKYWQFLFENYVALTGWLGWATPDFFLQVLLPIGISFYTFQTLSYLIEVYHGRQKAERNLLVFSTFILFFPQLVAGPIERPQHLLPQFHKNPSFDFDRITSGLRRMALGFFKKLVVADQLALYVNDVYASPEQYNGTQLTLATVFFAYQIYCDFSGYSDIAVGAARIMGFDLMQNFRAPYHSASVGEFWQRWHISLSTWFRDYVYIPLGGNRSGMTRWIVAILITFGVSGLWHGANWTFVLWGILNGLYLLVGTVTKKVRDRSWKAIAPRGSPKIRRGVGIVTTFLLTCVAWTFFRSDSIHEAHYILTHFWTDWDLSAIRTPNFLLRQLPFAIGGILAVEIIQLVQYRIGWGQLAMKLPTPARWTCYLIFVICTVLFGTFREAQFIYFQF